MFLQNKIVDSLSSDGADKGWKAGEPCATGPLA